MILTSKNFYLTRHSVCDGHHGVTSLVFDLHFPLGFHFIHFFRREAQGFQHLMVLFAQRRRFAVDRLESGRI